MIHSNLYSPTLSNPPLHSHLIPYLPLPLSYSFAPILPLSLHLDVLDYSPFTVAFPICLVFSLTVFNNLKFYYYIYVKMC